MASVEETTTTAVPRQQVTTGTPPRPSTVPASSTKRPLEGHSTPTPTKTKTSDSINVLTLFHQRFLYQ